MPAGTSTGTAARDKSVLRLNRSGQRLVYETNHPVRAGIGCRKRNRKTLSCAGAGVIGVGAVLGPKKDRFEAGERINRFLAVDAGGGSDRVRGGVVTSALLGGKGNDRLKGRGAPDALIGGKNRDRLRGGPGTDTERQ